MKKYFIKLTLLASILGLSLSLSSCFSTNKYKQKRLPLKNQEILAGSQTEKIKPKTQPQNATIKEPIQNDVFYNRLFNKKNKAQEIELQDEVANNNIAEIKQEYKKAESRKLPK